MADTIGVWEVSGKELKRAQCGSFESAYKEIDLESWVANDPDLLGQDLVIISRQWKIPSVGILDLLALDSDGKPVVIEFKRSKTSRETVAQALHYASYISRLSEEQLTSAAEKYLPGSLADAFSRAFQDPLPPVRPKDVRILVVAASEGPSAGEILGYLQAKGIEAEAVSFTFLKLSDGTEILARPVVDVGSPRPDSRPSAESLLAEAAEHGTEKLVEECRRLRGVLFESRSKYGGTFRYRFRSRGVVGVDIASKGSPFGQLDIWVYLETLSELAGGEAEVRAKLGSFEWIKETSKEIWIRLKSVEEAKIFTQQIEAWCKGRAEAVKA